MHDRFFLKPYQSVIYSSQNPLLAIWTWLWLWLCIFCSLTGVYRISRIKAMLLRLSWCGAASTVEHSAEEQEEPRNTETAAAWNFLSIYVHLHFWVCFALALRNSNKSGEVETYKVCKKGVWMSHKNVPITVYIGLFSSSAIQEVSKIPNSNQMTCFFLLSQYVLGTFLQAFLFVMY